MTPPRDRRPVKLLVDLEGCRFPKDPRGGFYNVNYFVPSLFDLLHANNYHGNLSVTMVVGLAKDKWRIQEQVRHDVEDLVRRYQGPDTPNVTMEFMDRRTAKKQAADLYIQFRMKRWMKTVRKGLLVLAGCDGDYIPDLEEIRTTDLNRDPVTQLPDLETFLLYEPGRTNYQLLAFFPPARREVWTTMLWDGYIKRMHPDRGPRPGGGDDGPGPSGGGGELGPGGHSSRWSKGEGSLWWQGGGAGAGAGSGSGKKYTTGGGRGGQKRVRGGSYVCVGDFGIQGRGSLIGKLYIYVVIGGTYQQRVLPIIMLVIQLETSSGHTFQVNQKIVVVGAGRYLMTVQAVARMVGISQIDATKNFYLIDEEVVEKVRNTLDSALSSHLPVFPNINSGLDPLPSSCLTNAEVPVVLGTEKQDSGEKWIQLKERMLRNGANIPKVVKRMRECIESIDKLDSLDVTIHPAFRRRRIN